jgi:NAD(P)-dependent dehydrogenase (short-subunit alcohol dehydrogenase family)
LLHCVFPDILDSSLRPATFSQDVKAHQKVSSRTVSYNLTNSPGALYRWKDRVCITGGGTGIRFACTEAFAQSGAKNIITTSRRAKILYDAEQKLSSKYPKSKFYALTTNVSKASDVEAMFKKVANDIGPIDISIANAGYAPTAEKIENMDISDFMCAVEVNLIGTYLCAMHFAKQASRRNDPVFINMSTGHAHAPPQRPISGYGVSKVAAAKAIDYVTYENPGIGVYQIHPGAIEKNMTADYPSKEMLREDIALPGALCVWLASSEGVFLRSRFLWASWDVDELVAMKEDFDKNPALARIGPKFSSSWL